MIFQRPFKLTIFTLIHCHAGSSQKIKPPANAPSRKQPLGTLVTESKSADTLHPLSPPRNTSAPHLIDPLDGTVHNPLGVTVSLDDLVDNADPLKTPKPMGNKSTSLDCLRVQSGEEIFTMHGICISSGVG